MLRRLILEAMRWIGGLTGLLAVDLFAELYVFEWLEWNGTDKNDWFFMLWWGVVLIWTLSCGHRAWRRNSCPEDGLPDDGALSSHHD